MRADGPCVRVRLLRISAVISVWRSSPEGGGNRSLHPPSPETGSTGSLSCPGTRPRLTTPQREEGRAPCPGKAADGRDVPPDGALRGGGSAPPLQPGLRTLVVALLLDHRGIIIRTDRQQLTDGNNPHLIGDRLKSSGAAMWQRLQICCTLFTLYSAAPPAHINRLALFPDKSAWCEAKNITQIVGHTGCQPRSIQNRACLGQCFSYSVPNTFPQSTESLVHCDSCMPAQTQWEVVTLDCPGSEESPRVDKLVERIFHCSCQSCSKDGAQEGAVMQLYPADNTLLTSPSLSDPPSKPQPHPLPHADTHSNKQLHKDHHTLPHTSDGG